MQPLPRCANATATWACNLINHQAGKGAKIETQVQVSFYRGEARVVSVLRPPSSYRQRGPSVASAVNDIDDPPHDEIMDINLKGVAFTLQAVLPDQRWPFPPRCAQSCCVLTLCR